jgi:hypothetical protein
MILLAGLGAAAVVHVAPGRVLKGFVVVALAASVGYLAWQAHRASFVDYEDPHNPYVYAHTTSDVLDLCAVVREITAEMPQGRATTVQVICPDKDFWPLPWYLRDFPRVGWYETMPPPPEAPAPLIIIQPEMRPALIRYLYEDQEPGQRPLYVEVSRDGGGDWQLQPNVPLTIYMLKKVWDRHHAAKLELPDRNDRSALP